MKKLGKPFQIRFHVATEEYLDRGSQKTGISKADLVRMAVDRLSILSDEDLIGSFLSWRRDHEAEREVA